MISAELGSEAEMVSQLTRSTDMYQVMGHGAMPFAIDAFSILALLLHSEPNRERKPTLSIEQEA